MPSLVLIWQEISISFVPFFKGIISDIKLGLPLVLTFCMDFILSGIDRYIIAIFLSVNAVGDYSVGYKVASIILIFPRAIGAVLPQLLSKSIDNSDQNLAKRMVEKSIKIFMLISIPFCFGSIILGKPLITFLANEEIAQKCIFVMPIIAIGSIFFGLYIILSDILFIHLKTKELFKINLTAALSNIVLNFSLFLFSRDNCRSHYNID